MVAAIIKYYQPKLVGHHSYVPASSMRKMISNWDTLNK